MKEFHNDTIKGTVHIMHKVKVCLQALVHKIPNQSLVSRKTCTIPNTIHIFQYNLAPKFCTIFIFPTPCQKPYSKKLINKTRLKKFSLVELVNQPTNQPTNKQTKKTNDDTVYMYLFILQVIYQIIISWCFIYNPAYSPYGQGTDDDNDDDNNALYIFNMKLRSDDSRYKRHLQLSLLVHFDFQKIFNLMLI